MRALLVGCGNIGAFYDWDSKLVLTYAKAFKTIGIDFCVYDKNISTASKVANRFGVNCINTLEGIDLSAFDIGVISSSTSTHGFYLSKFFEASPKLIICEKPVEADITNLDKALSEYLSSSARVLVNYHRPFQPAMKKLALLVKALHAKRTCQGLVITYQRGLLNNATHAFDLVSHLFGQVFRPKNINILKKNYDEFENDPTISMTCEWIGIPVHFVGISFAKFSHFDISFYFSDCLIELRRGGGIVLTFTKQT